MHLHGDINIQDKVSIFLTQSLANFGHKILRLYPDPDLAKSQDPDPEHGPHKPVTQAKEDFNFTRPDIQITSKHMFGNIGL